MDRRSSGRSERISKASTLMPAASSSTEGGVAEPEKKGVTVRGGFEGPATGGGCAVSVYLSMKDFWVVDGRNFRRKCHPALSVNQ
jgi:hypothetical protein